MSTQVSAHIVECRRRFGITQEELAAEAGLPIDQLRCIEAGSERPAGGELEVLAGAFEKLAARPSEARRMLLEGASGPEPGS